jgi:hypothetical protein
MLLEMPFLAAINSNINLTQGTFKGKVIAISMDAYKWKPDWNSKVFKPFINHLPEGYRHYECSNDSLYFINIDSDNYTSHIDPNMSTYI